MKERSLYEYWFNFLSEIINTIYSKVPNPLNKHLSEEDKEAEKFFFLSIIFKTNSFEEINQLNIDIKEHKSIKIPQSLRQIAQTIYRIRSNLRFKRQNGTQNDYLRLYNNLIEKLHFLLKFNSKKTLLSICSQKYKKYANFSRTFYSFL